jgi:asparagine synthase (glutamine-hydrolysing)
MEGIAGTYGETDKALVMKMLSKLEHRGPDIQSIHSDEKAALGARKPQRRHDERLLAVAEDGGVAVASDSYLLNKEFLRWTIVPKMDKTVSDARLMLEMYKIVGARMFGYIEGAYAVAIVSEGKTLLARDTYGLKPLYISGDARRGAYSSEMKSQIVADEKFVPFPPGTLFESGEGYRKISQTGIPWAKDPGPENPAERTKCLLIRSVLGCMEDTSGFNVLLSGGIDSSAVAAAAAEITPDIHSVCVGTEQSEDLRMARLVADHLGTVHDERVYDVEDMLEILDEVIYYAESFDYPLVRSCIPNFMATHMFSDRHRPILCGEGGDEVFAGYEYLARIRTDAKLLAERKALLDSGHLTGFQRVDRMTSSASLDGRMPFMSPEIVDFGLELGKRELIGKKPEHSKLVLRKAFKKDLPKDVVWRRKQKFSEGAGSINALAKLADKQISDKEFERESKTLAGGRIRTKEELLYFRIFQRHYPSTSATSAVGCTARP